MISECVYVSVRLEHCRAIIGIKLRCGISVRFIILSVILELEILLLYFTLFYEVDIRT